VRRRYLALRVLAEQSFNKRDVADAVWNAVLKLFGEYGASQTAITFIEYSPEKSWGILSCSHKTLEMVRASVASVTEINGKPVAIDVVGVSGTLRSLRERVCCKGKRS
jgi:ribonuclease P/MRP protein subunit POP5